jgi:hypothetical protein
VAGDKEGLHDRLVHADGRAEHSGAYVRHVGELQQTLHRAVFPVRTVEHRKDDVESDPGDGGGSRQIRRLRAALDGQHGVLARMRHEMRFAARPRRARRLEPDLVDDVRRRHRRGRLVGERPSPVLFDADRDRLVAAAVEVLDDRGGRRDRHLVLPRASAVNHADT